MIFKILRIEKENKLIYQLTITLAINGEFIGMLETSHKKDILKAIENAYFQLA